MFCDEHIPLLGSRNSKLAKIMILGTRSKNYVSDLLGEWNPISTLNSWNHIYYREMPSYIGHWFRVSHIY